MVALYVTSPEGGRGKTTVGAGVGKHLLSEGKKIGFFKPVIADKAEDSDSDVAFMKHLLSLDEPIDRLRPVFSDRSNLAAKIKEAYAKVAEGKDVVIIEGVSDQDQTSLDIVETLDARVIVVEGYSQELAEATTGSQDFGEHLLGVVLNKVPKSRLERARSEASARYDKPGVNILGVLPEDRTLLALTIGELAEHIQGEILSGAEKSAELVENLMLGAMVIDHGPEYFGRKANKAVVLRNERPDMQLAALDTSTRCLVLTGDTEPKPVVLHQAEEKNVPVILTRDDTVTIVTNIEDALGKARFNQANKLPRLAEIMERHFDFPLLYKGLGLASQR